jgi:hypothetical protein
MDNLKDEINNVIDNLLNEGLIQRDGDFIRLTEQGETYMIKVLGGRDVYNLCHAILQTLKDIPILGSSRETSELIADGSPIAFAIIHRAVMLLKPYFDEEKWKKIVEDFEKEILDNTDFFKNHSRAFLDFPSGVPIS